MKQPLCNGEWSFLSSELCKPFRQILLIWHISCFFLLIFSLIFNSKTRETRDLDDKISSPKILSSNSSHLVSKDPDPSNQNNKEENVSIYILQSISFLNSELTEKGYWIIEMQMVLIQKECFIYLQWTFWREIFNIFSLLQLFFYYFLYFFYAY